MTVASAELVLVYLVITLLVPLYGSVALRAAHSDWGSEEESNFKSEAI